MSSGLRTLLLLVGFVLVAPAGDLSAQAASAPASDPMVGAWILNVAKSTSDPGPQLKGETRTFDYARDGMILSTRQRVEANGERTFGHWLCKMDDEFYPEFSRALGTTPVSWLAFKKVDARKIEIRVRHDGVVDGSGSFTLSSDGKTLTYVLQTTNAQGRRTHFRVYDKQ